MATRLGIRSLDRGAPEAFGLRATVSLGSGHRLRLRGCGRSAPAWLPFGRGPTDHVNVRILHSGSKAHYIRGDTRNLGSSCFCGLLGPQFERSSTSWIKTTLRGCQ